MCWYENDKQRFVLEHLLITRSYPNFQLQKISGEISWEGEVSLIPRELNDPPLRIRIICNDGYPIVAPKIKPISPSIPDEHWGHKWHRWKEGYLCIVKPNMWKATYYIIDIIEKAEMWYFNYLAFKNNLIDKMPDSGLAKINNERVE